METFLLYALLGIGSGAVYSILATGLIAIYKGSGTLNFAQAAIAMFAGYGYVALRQDSVPTVASIVLVLLGAALGGFLFAYIVMRPLRTAPVLARVVVTLGLFTALTALVLILWPNTAVVTVVHSIFPEKSVQVFGGQISSDRFWLAGVAIVLTIALWALYRFSNFGRATRAASENERGAALVGFSPEFIAAGNWALGCGLAGLAGILVVPLTGLQTSVALLIVPVLAAALVGRFSSFAVVTVAAFAIGSMQSLVGNYWGSQPGVQEAVPFLVVIVAMVATGRLIPERGTGSLDRLPLAPSSKFRPIPAALLMAGVIILLAVVSHQYQIAIATSLVMGIIALSLVVVTGYVGQISLAQMAFAGVGAFAVSKFAGNMGIPFPIPILMAAFLAVPIGILIGLPALRVRGINLAVITLGAAVTLSAMVFANPKWTSTVGQSTVPSPHLWGLSLDPNEHPVPFGIFCAIVLLIVSIGVINLRRSGSGRRMLAVRGNERAAAAAGVSVSATKLQAFAISAFIGALGGGVLAYQVGSVSYYQFEPMLSITLLTIVFIGSIAAVSGGLVAGLITSGGLTFVLFSNLGAVGNWWQLASGVIVIVNVLFVPDGVAVAYAEGFHKLRARYTNGSGPPKPSPTGGPSPVAVEQVSGDATPTI